MKNSNTRFPHSFRSYVLSDLSAWFWGIIIFSILTFILVFAIPEESYPIVYIRHVFGIIYAIFLPGYCFIRTFYPESFSPIEITLFSLGLSIFFIFIIGLILSFSPWGLSLLYINSSLLALILGFSTIGLLREYRGKFKQQE